MLPLFFLSFRTNMYSISNYATCLKQELNEHLFLTRELNVGCGTTVLFHIMKEK